jgi:hypothetical protein
LIASAADVHDRPDLVFTITGICSLLREAYGDEDIPLESVRKVVETWRLQKGNCSVSRIKLQFPVEGISETPAYDGSLLTPMDRFALQRQFEKEEAQRKRAGELHAPSLDYAEDGTLRLISRTVARWREGLSEDEFRNLIRILHSEVNPAFPESHSFNSSAAGSLSMSRRLIR